MPVMFSITLNLCSSADMLSTESREYHFSERAGVWDGCASSAIIKYLIAQILFACGLCQHSLVNNIQYSRVRNHLSAPVLPNVLGLHTLL